MRVRAVVIGLLIALAAAAPAAAAPVLHAHRGGALDLGRPVFPEDTPAAFANAAAIGGTWLEMDTVVSADGVPYVIHDSTLDRTTDCTGAVLEKTAAEIDACRVDRIGVSETLVEAPPTPVVRVPRLRDVLAFARERGAPVNLEIKRIPGDPGYVPGDTSFAAKVMEVVVAAKLDPAKLIVQSFDPTNLDVAASALPGVQLSFLTLAQANEGAPEFAASRGYHWVSPGGVPSSGFVQRARSYGLKVVPYTLNSADEVKAAAALGVDAIITDDLPVARDALGLPIVRPGVEVAAGPPAVTFPRRSLRAVRRARGFRVTVEHSRALTVRVTARLGRTVVARGSVRLRGAGTRSATVRLTSAGRRVLARRRSATLRLTVDIAGRRTTRTLRLR